MKRVRQVASLTVTLLALGASTALADSWTQYQFNGAHTGNPPETTLSPSNVDRLVFRFGAVVAAAPAVSEPIVVNGVAYTGISAATANRAGRVAAFDASTGAMVWSAYTCGNGGTSMPAFSGGRVWVQSGDGALSGLDSRTGVVRACVQGSPPPTTRNAPCAAGGSVYVTDATGGIRAVNASTGQILWDQNALQPLSTPACGKRFVYVSSVFSAQPSVVFKLRSSDGSLVWRTVAALRGSSTVTVGAGHVFLSSLTAVIALDASSGAREWRTTGLGTPTPPSFAKGRVFVGTAGEGGGEGGGAAALDASTGAIIWHRSDTGPLSAPITVANGVLYGIGTNEGPLLMYRTANGDVLATRTSVTDPQGIYDTGAGVTVVNGIVYAPDANAGTIDAWSL